MPAPTIEKARQFIYGMLDALYVHQNSQYTPVVPLDADAAYWRGLGHGQGIGVLQWGRAGQDAPIYPMATGILDGSLALLRGEPMAVSLRDLDKAEASAHKVYQAFYCLAYTLLQLRGWLGIGGAEFEWPNPHALLWPARSPGSTLAFGIAPPGEPMDTDYPAWEG